MAITTSPYISGPDILEHPTRSVKEVRLDFSGVADGCIKAGSPINAAGKVANDATAIGILLHDNYSDCGCGHGMVVVAGRIKADVAEQHCGIAISAEAKGGMPAVAFVNAAGVVTGGAVSWDDLTDKPFGNIPTGSDTLTWDGNTEGRYSFVYTGLTFVHVSDSIPAVSELQGAKVLVGYGVSKAEYTIPAGNITILDDVIHIAGNPQMVVALTDNAKFYNKVIEKAGLYFSTTFGGTPVTDATLTISGYDGFPTDKTIDAKYLPEGYPSYDPVGGRNLVYEWSGTLERNSATGTHMIDIANTNKKLLTIGTTYAVTFGGKEFICVCDKNRSQHAYLGTQNLRPRAETEPFYIYVNSRNGDIHVEVDTGTYASTVSVTFSISEIVPLTVPIAEKFLPDSVKGGGSSALVFTENQQGELTANMSVEEACNSIRAGMSPMLIRQKSGETEIWCFAGGMLGDGWTSVNFRESGGNTVSVMFDSGIGEPFIAE